MSQIANALELIEFIKTFTGSKDDSEIKECVLVIVTLLQKA